MSRKRLAAWIAVAVFLGLATALVWLDPPLVRWPARVLLGGGLLLVALWLLWKALSAFLWRVGRRLAFSYFLIGVLPIPMVAILFLLALYLHSGFFLGHLYRDAVGSLAGELAHAAEERHAALVGGATPPATGGDGIAFGVYADGQRVRGDPALPERFPAWLAGGDPEAEEGARDDREAVAPLVALPGGRPSLAAAVGGPGTGVVALWVGDVEAELSRRSDISVRLVRSDDPEKENLVRVKLGRAEIPLQPPLAGVGGAEAGDGGEKPPWLDRRVVWWGELSGALHDLADGRVVAEYVAASLDGSPREVYRHLVSSSAEVDAVAIATAFAVAGLLSTIYAVALGMALLMIFTLSRAVNRLSHATEAVRGGDFGARIPVRRKDQIGELQRSFNQMAANLEELVATATQKELLEKELEIAREVQKSLLPRDLPEAEDVEFATLFEPSAAIGGDYFDILRLGDDRLGVVIADVSGHGLPTGLRMAMLKAALTILAEEGREPREILGRLDRLIRASDDARYFVTTTFARLELGDGSLELTNAGHPPTYVVRHGEVEEIILPGPPLGALGDDYGRRDLRLEPGDVVVWLSDGLIEATSGDDEQFGYEGVRRALAGSAPSAAAARDRVVEAVARHTRGRPPEDDRTLVAMAYRPTADVGGASTPSAE